MKVLRLCWLGIATDEYEQMRRLFQNVLGLKVEFELPTTIEFSAETRDDRVQLFAPGSRYFDFFKSEAHGPVALFEVDDVRCAHGELVTAGIEIVGDFEQDADWEWLHFRAPDGTLCVLASRLRPRS